MACWAVRFCCAWWTCMIGYEQANPHGRNDGGCAFVPDVQCARPPDTRTSSPAGAERKDSNWLDNASSTLKRLFAGRGGTGKHGNTQADAAGQRSSNNNTGLSRQEYRALQEARLQAKRWVAQTEGVWQWLLKVACSCTLNALKQILKAWHPDIVQRSMRNIYRREREEREHVQMYNEHASSGEQAEDKIAALPAADSGQPTKLLTKHEPLGYRPVATRPDSSAGASSKCASGACSTTESPVAPLTPVAGAYQRRHPLQPMGTAPQDGQLAPCSLSRVSKCSGDGRISQQVARPPSKDGAQEPHTGVPAAVINVVASFQVAAACAAAEVAREDPYLQLGAVPGAVADHGDSQEHCTVPDGYTAVHDGLPIQDADRQSQQVRA